MIENKVYCCYQSYINEAHHNYDLLIEHFKIEEAAK